MSRLGVSCALATGIAFIVNPMAGIVVGLSALTAYAVFSDSSDTPSQPTLPAVRPDICSVAPRDTGGLRKRSRRLRSGSLKRRRQRSPKQD